MGFLHPRPPPLGDILLQSTRALKMQQYKLEQVTVRLKERDKVLFQACITAVKCQDRERAVICATELAEVRKLITLLSHTQIAIERIILRLETIRELNVIFGDLKPALTALKNITNNLAQIMPDVASELSKVNECINETLLTTRMSLNESPIPVNIKTPGGQQILQEAELYVERQLTEKLPEPPPTIMVASETVKEKKQVAEMVALAATCGEETTPEDESSKSFSYENVKLQKLSLTIERSTSISDAVFDYVKKSGGRIDIPECANKLNVSIEDVVKALEDLGAQGKIRIEA
jgi:division protein CdvB (Snf7/Vps24/ESCRT-III family)